MGEIDLKYGRTTLPLRFDEDRFSVIGDIAEPRALSDAEVGGKLDDPQGTDALETIVGAGQSVLFVVPDATREVGCGQVVNLLVRRLIAAGVAPFDITIIFATGIHRAVTEAEKAAILTPFIAQRVKTIAHGPRDLMQILKVGETRTGISVELNRALFEHDHVVLIGGAAFHYFAGFTGGRKLICPGLASAKTINATHKLAFDCESKSRRQGVGTGMLAGNAVHEAFVDAAAFARPAFAVTTIVNSCGQIVDLYCGDWIDSHRAACDAYAEVHTVELKEKRELVIVSCGGLPHDINMIQAHKALEAAAHACTEDGTIILIAECSDGMGRGDFLDWFDAENSEKLAERLCEKYQVNGQTAWSLLEKAEDYNVRVFTSLDPAVLDRITLRPISEAELFSAAAGSTTTSGYIIPSGARARFKLN